VAPITEPIGVEIDELEAEDGMTTAPVGAVDDEPTADRDAVNPNDDEMDEIDTPEEAETLINNEEAPEEIKN
jgi:hypothetical protein